MVVQYKLSIVVLPLYQNIEDHSINGDLLLFVQMRFVFFSSKKEANGKVIMLRGLFLLLQ